MKKSSYWRYDLEKDTTIYKPGTYRVLEFSIDRYVCNGDFFVLSREATIDEIQSIIGGGMDIPKSSYWIIDIAKTTDELPTIYNL
mgnify:CR=1 FL=1